MVGGSVIVPNEGAALGEDELYPADDDEAMAQLEMTPVFDPAESGQLGPSMAVQGTRPVRVWRWKGTRFVLSV